MRHRVSQSGVAVLWFWTCLCLCLCVRLAGAGNLVVRMSNVTKLERSSAKLECLASNAYGINRAKYYWFKDGVNITKMRNDHLTVRENVLLIPDVRRRDTGFYRCLVDLRGSLAQAVAYLDVQYLPETYGQSRTVYMQAGEMGRLECPSSANPPVTVTHWYENSVKLQELQLMKRNMLVNGTDLVFLSVNHSHAGVYSCVPQSKLGISVTNSARISVIVGEMVHFGIRPEPYYQRRVNESATFPCSAFGYPSPQTFWYRSTSGSAPLTSRMRIDSGKLTIDSVQLSDQGTYVCTANNSLGRIATTTELIVETIVAHPPTDVTIIAGVESAHVRWMPAYDHGQPLSYYMLYRKIGGAWTTLPVIPDNQLRVTVYGLEADTDWEVVVVAHRANARWESDQATFRTKERGAGAFFLPSEFEVVSQEISAPRNLSAIRLLNVVYLTWQPPKGYPKVDYYVLQYRIDSQKWSYTSNINGNRTEHRFFPQISGHYSFRLFAVVMNARSSYSEEVPLFIPAQKELTEGLSITSAPWYLVGIILSLLLVINLIILIVRLTMKLTSHHTQSKSDRKEDGDNVDGLEASKTNGSSTYMVTQNGGVISMSPETKIHNSIGYGYDHAHLVSDTVNGASSITSAIYQHKAQAFLAASRSDIMLGNQHSQPQLPYTQYQLSRQIRLSDNDVTSPSMPHPRSHPHLHCVDDKERCSTIDMNVSTLYLRRHTDGDPLSTTTTATSTTAANNGDASVGQRELAAKSLDRKNLRRKENDALSLYTEQQRRRRIVTIQLPDGHVNREDRWSVGSSATQPVVVLKTVQMEAAV